MQYFTRSVIITIIVVIYFIISHLKWELLAKVCCCCCSVSKSCPTLCNVMDCSTPGFPVLHYLPKVAQIHVHWVSDAIYPSYPLSPLSPFASTLPQLAKYVTPNQGDRMKENRTELQWKYAQNEVAGVLVKDKGQGITCVKRKKKKKTFRFQDSQECHPSTSAQVWGKRVAGSGFETPRSCPDEHW